MGSGERSSRRPPSDRAADDRAAKSLSTETGLPLQTSITRHRTRHRTTFYAGDDVGRVLRWVALP